MLKIAFDKSYRHPLGENHRFPMIKYELIPEQLIRKNICTENSFFAPSEISKENAILTHQDAYYDRLVGLSLNKADQRQIGFPLSKSLVKRERTIAQGSIQNCQYALKHGISMNIAGGTHHAFKDKPGAFCMLNDQAIAANYLIENRLAKSVMIVDLDVHQGNGTASIFKDNDNVYTLSFHGKKNYPFRKEKSDFDCEFEDGTDDEFYLKKLKTLLPVLIDRIEPQFVFYLAGVDVLKNDKLGRLSLSLDGCKERDRFVMETCSKFKIPLQISMGGGYSSCIDEIVEAHCNTFKLAQQIYFHN